MLVNSCSNTLIVDLKGHLAAWHHRAPNGLWADTRPVEDTIRGESITAHNDFAALRDREGFLSSFACCSSTKFSSGRVFQNINSCHFIFIAKVHLENLSVGLNSNIWEFWSDLAILINNLLEPSRSSSAESFLRINGWDGVEAISSKFHLACSWVISRLFMIILNLIEASLVQVGFNKIVQAMVVMDPVHGWSSLDGILQLLSNEVEVWLEDFGGLHTL
mmetsp:Transcript_25290/g.37625  ORF Transcript_25290/g.37625 Transcript_25290/m.37625 type:complete len:219 (+) Transcript_25290:1185-1841(+)